MLLRFVRYTYSVIFQRKDGFAFRDFQVQTDFSLWHCIFAGIGQKIVEQHLYQMLVCRNENRFIGLGQIQCQLLFFAKRLEGGDFFQQHFIQTKRVR